MKSDLGVFEDRSHGDGELLPTTVALIEALATVRIGAFFAVKLRILADDSTVRTDRTIGPQKPFEVDARRILVLILWSDDGHERYRLSPYALSSAQFTWLIINVDMASKNARSVWRASSGKSAFASASVIKAIQRSLAACVIANGKCRARRRG